MSEDHRSYITTARLGSGWAAIELCWVPEHGGYWDIWQTGCGRYATKAEAEEEAKHWADAEDLKFKPQKEEPCSS